MGSDKVYIHIIYHKLSTKRAKLGTLIERTQNLPTQA